MVIPIMHAAPTHTTRGDHHWWEKRSVLMLKKMLILMKNGDASPNGKSLIKWRDDKV